MAHDEHAGRLAASASASASSRQYRPSYQDIGPALTQSVDRLPTVSASQALFLNKDDSPPPVLFGLDRLDRLLHRQREDSDAPTGIPRGRVTELYGPPGAGKTALWLVSFKHSKRDQC